MASASLVTFTCFPKLPPELRKLIWSWAAFSIAASSQRVFWVTPDPDDYEDQSTFVALQQQLRICPNRTFSNPILLTVCRDARLAALKEYTVWGLAEVESLHAPIAGAAYINKTYDTVYYRGMSTFFLLDLLKSANDRPRNFHSPILLQLLAQFGFIQNLAMSWEQWHLLFDDGHDISWLGHLPPLKVLTIVYRLPDEDLSDRFDTGPTTLAARLVPLKRHTVRQICGNKIRWWTQECLQLFSEKFPEHSIPRVCVRQFWSAESNDTTRCDLNFEKMLDQDYRLEGQRHFGTMPPRV